MAIKRFIAAMLVIILVVCNVGAVEWDEAVVEEPQFDDEFVEEVAFEDEGLTWDESDDFDISNNFGSVDFLEPSEEISFAVEDGPGTEENGFPNGDQLVSVGNYGVNLSCVSYTAASNPFAQSGWVGQCTWYAWGRANEKFGVNVPCRGNAKDWYYTAGDFRVDSTPSANSIAVWTTVSDTGHVAFVEAIDDDIMYITEANYNNPWTANFGENGYSEGYFNLSSGWYVGTYNDRTSYSRPMPQYYIHVKDEATTPRGSEMFSGYDMVLPDGDYIIGNAADRNYFLDISGGDYPAPNGTNVNLWHAESVNNIGDHDVWTIKYSDGFYRISQYKQNVSLDVDGADTLCGANVHAWENNDSSAQKWAISRNGGSGYRIQAKCSGYSLDLSGGTLDEGINVRQWENNDSDAQRWVFIPYKPEHTLPDGRYILVSAMNPNLELDIAGNTFDIKNGTNVQVWNDDSSEFYEKSLSKYNAFDVKYYADGYYQLTQAVSGKAIDVDSWTWNNGQNIQMWDNTGVIAQLWAITKNRNGYILRPKCSGLCMTIKDSKTEDGTNVHQVQYWNGYDQTWKFIPAEYKVSYNANGGTGAPSAQTKYYKGKLVLSSAKPTRPGYAFSGWNTNANGNGTIYQPGVEYKVDQNVTLYAMWNTIGYGVNYNANGGSGAPAVQRKNYDVALTLSSIKPTREGYTFLYWNTKADGSGTTYNPGDSYTVNATTVLYAIWTPLPTITATPKPALLPAPTGVTTKSINPADGTATIKFSGVTGAEKYRVNYRQAGTSTWKRMESISTTVVLTGLLRGTAYEIRVAAGDVLQDGSTQWGTRSGYLRIWIQTVSQNKTKNNGVGSFIVSWEMVSGASKYRIYYASNKAMNGKKSIVVSGNRTTTILSGMNSGTNYYVRIRPYTIINGKTYYGEQSNKRSRIVK